MIWNFMCIQSRNTTPIRKKDVPEFLKMYYTYLFVYVDVHMTNDNLWE